MNTWRDLDPSVRKALLRGEPAGDPETDRIGRAYAEQKLGRSQLRLLLIGVPIGLVGGLLVGQLLVMDILTIAAAVPLLLVFWLGWWIVEARRKLALVRLLNVSHGAPRVPVVPAVSERLEVRVATLGVLRVMLPWLFVFAVPITAGLLFSTPAIVVVAAILAVPVIAYIAHLLAWSIPGHPTVFDADGMHSPKDGVRIGWDTVREIRIVPLRATAGDRRYVLALLLHDDQVYLRQLPSWQVLLGKLNKKTYLSPLVLMDGMYDKSMAEVGAVAAALSGIPVSAAPRQRQ